TSWTARRCTTPPRSDAAPVGRPFGLPRGVMLGGGEIGGAGVTGPDWGCLGPVTPAPQGTGRLALAARKASHRAKVRGYLVGRRCRSGALKDTHHHPPQDGPAMRTFEFRRRP